MKSLFAIAFLFAASFAHAESGVATADLGIKLSPEGSPYVALTEYAHTVQGATFELIENTVEVYGISSSSNFGDAEAIDVRFVLHDTASAVTDGSDELFCDGTIELKNSAWSFNGGCEP